MKTSSIKPYLKRLKKLQKGFEISSNKTLKAKYNRAIDLTDEAAKTYIRLVEAAEQESKAYSGYTDKETKSINTYRKQLIERADKLAAQIRQDKNVEDQKQEIDKIVRGERDLNVRAEHLAQLDDLRGKRVARSRERGTALLEKVFKPDESEFRKSVAIKAIEFGIGAIPIAGMVCDGGKKIYEAIEHDKHKIITANEVLTYLDDYCETVETWLVAAEADIKMLEENEEDFG